MDTSLKDLIIMPAILLPGMFMGFCVVGGLGLCYLCYIRHQQSGVFVDVPASLPNNDVLRQEQAPVGNLEVEMQEIRDGNGQVHEEAMPSHPDSTGSEGGIIDVLVEHAQEAGVSATVNAGPLVEQTGTLFIGAPFEEHFLHWLLSWCWFTPYCGIAYALLGILVSWPYVRAIMRKCRN